MSGEDSEHVSASDHDSPPEPVEDLAKSLLARAKSVARTQGRGRRGGPGPTPVPEGRSAGPYSGARPDDRDPQLLAGELARLVADRGWKEPVRVASIEARWAELVGEQLAAHCKPERFSEGELVVVAESTAWATQVRLLGPRLIGAVNGTLGEGLVRKLVVHGPTTPSWRRGRLRVSDGRGPRDTYG